MMLLAWLLSIPALASDPAPQDAGTHEEPEEGPVPGGASPLVGKEEGEDPRKGIDAHPHDPPGAGDEPFEIHAWARGGYRAETSREHLHHGPYMSLARLQVRLSDQERFAAFVQLGADQGELALLDARATVYLADEMEFSVGRFKVPISHDWLVPAEQMLVPTRALLDGFAPLRAIGLQGRWTRRSSSWNPTLRVGVFDPLAPGSGRLGGAQVVVQGGVHGGSGLLAHAAAAAWIHDPEVDHLALGAVPWDRQVDVALGYVGKHLSLEVEGLAARTVEDGLLQGGTTAFTAVRIPLASQVMVEPVAAWDVRYTSKEDVLQRFTGAVNIHQDGWHLVESLAYEVEVGEDVDLHTVIAQVQAGL